MALGRISIKVGNKGKALPHSKYILREDQYAPKNNKLEKLEHIEHGNMPTWAEHDPKIFWQMADLYERKNGSAYREHIISLPRELNESQRLNLVQDWIKQEIGDKYAYSFAIHNPTANDGKEQPHCHLMFSERLLDRIERDPEQFFKRYNSKDPSKGGAKKDNTGLDYATRKQQIKDQRNRWENLCNKHLAKAWEFIPEPPPEIDMRNWQQRGLDSQPVNLTMQQMNDPEIKQAYKAMLQARNDLKIANDELFDLQLDLNFAEPSTPKPKAPTPFDAPKPQPGPTKTQDEKKIIEWRPKPTQPQAGIMPPPPIAPPSAGSQGVALPTRKAGGFAEKVQQQLTAEHLEKIKQLKTPTAPIDSAIYVVDKATGEREKIDLNSKDIINRLADLDKTQPNALLIIQTPNKDIVNRLEKEIAEHGKDDRYIVLHGGENMNVQQAKQESEQRINAIKQVLANETNSPGPTSENDPAPATPKPAPTRRHRP